MTALPPEPASADAPLTAIGEAQLRTRVSVSGRIAAITYSPVDSLPELTLRLKDTTGTLLLVFVGRTEVAGLTAGRRLTASGMTADRDGTIAIFNPVYELHPKELR